VASIIVLLSIFIVLRGNALLDAPRPAPQSGANRHSHAERGNED